MHKFIMLTIFIILIISSNCSFSKLSIGKLVKEPVTKIEVYCFNQKICETVEPNTISVHKTTLKIIGSARFIVKGYTDKGKEIDIIPIWSVSDNNVVEIKPTVGSSVTAKVLKKGVVTITVEYEGIIASGEITFK